MYVLCEQPYGNIGNVMKEQNNLEGAALFYKKALKLQPDFADALGNLAAVELMQVRQALSNTLLPSCHTLPQLSVLVACASEQGR